MLGKTNHDRVRGTAAAAITIVSGVVLACSQWFVGMLLSVSVIIGTSGITVFAIGTIIIILSVIHLEILALGL